MLKVVSKSWSYTFSVTNGTKSLAQPVDLSCWPDMGELRTQDARRRRWTECCCVTWPMMWMMLLPLAIVAKERSIDTVWKPQHALSVAMSELELRGISGRTRSR